MTGTFPGDVTRVAFAGDWHGDTFYACCAIKQLAGRVDVVLHTGDFGYQFTPAFLGTVTAAAREANLLVLFVDGNHENFDWLETQPVDPDGVQRLTDRVWHLPRGFRWEWAGLRFLALGGAVSIDRKARVPYLSWWPQERITYGQAVAVASDGPTDVMVTHDCPSGAAIPSLRSHLYSPDAVAECEAHRHLLAEVVQAVRPRFLWHGHYHVHHQALLGLGGGDACQVRGLDCNGVPLDRNLDVVDLTTLA